MAGYSSRIQLLFRALALAFSPVLFGPIAGAAVSEDQAVYSTLPSNDPLRAFNLITPNGDGRNDVWAITGLDNLGSYHIRVTTRTGQVVFETDHYRQDWDGTHRGQPLPAGVYHYSIAIAGQKKAVTGHVTILY